MSRPVLLDLFAGEGGAAKGYHDAGFDVVGVDIVDQPNYPYEFHRGDAMTWPLDGFDAVHASPPCQDHTEMWTTTDHGTGWMLAATVERLAASGLPYVVENVPGADMPGAYTLCGRAFGIRRLKRHRQFITSFPLLVPACACRGAGQPLGIYGDLRAADRWDNKRRRAGVDTARDLLGCPWMSPAGLTQAIPPLYTEFLGGWLLDYLAAAVTT